jgi:site-specific recombinase
MSDSRDRELKEVAAYMVSRVERGDGVDPLCELVARLRPERSDGGDEAMRGLVRALESSDGLGERLGRVFRDLVGGVHLYPAFTESGVPSTHGFLGELTARLIRRFVPERDPPADLRSLIRHLFSDPHDHEWLADVSPATWRDLLSALGVQADSLTGIDAEHATAIRGLAHHIASLGLQPEIHERLPGLDEAVSPFMRLSAAALRYVEGFENGEPGGQTLRLREALDVVELCRESVQLVRDGNREHGTSLRLTGFTYRLDALLDRIEILLHLSEVEEDQFRESLGRFVAVLVAAEKNRNAILPHVREHVDLLALEIVEHSARKGSKYITSGRRDWWKFFVASLWGGVIVACFSLFKTLMAQWGLPLGIEAILFGLNYSACFVLIYLTGSALATKQPAMTANTIARELGDPEQRTLERLEELVVRVWRSQFISFVGNLAAALPVAFLLSMAFARVTGTAAAPEYKAESMLAALHPLQSGTVFYAVAAGFFLFAAGLVSGWVDNRSLNRDVPRRVSEQPFLTSMVGSGGARRVGDFLDRNLGIIVGNVFLGFALGSLGTLGELLGLPLDIRHIAFASAEFGTALESLQLDVAGGLIAAVAIGILLIGLINFLVSFGLSLAMALESRRLTWRELRTVIGHLGTALVRRPIDWFWPPRSRSVEEGQP